MFNSLISDNRRYSVTYDRYITSEMNRNDNEFFDENGMLRFDVHDVQYTLEEKISFCLDKNLLRLDMNLYAYTERGKDHPTNYTRYVYENFIRYFYNRQINQQTIDLHRIKLQNFFESKKFEMINFFKASTQYQFVDTSNTEKTDTGGNTVSKLYRGADSTVPENEVNVDVASTSLSYADSFQKTKEDTTTVNDSKNSTLTTNTKDRDFMELLDIQNYMEKLYRDAIRQDIFM